MTKQKSKSDKQVNKNKKEKLPQVPEKYQKLANLQYVRDNEARAEIMEMIDEFQKMDDLVLQKTGGHDLSVRYKGRQVVKICPLSKAWSASIQGGNIQRYTKKQVLEKMRQIVNNDSQKGSSSREETIKQLEKRIKNMSKKSKGISLKGVDITKDVESWIKKQGYSIYDGLLLVK